MNHLESFDLQLEHDDGYQEGLFSPETVDEIAALKIILCGDSEEGDRTMAGCSYLWVDPDYVGQLSPGQQRCWEILKAIQQSSIYTVTSVGKLAEGQELTNPLACYERLGNLQSLGAIAGFKD